ncbi:hypothetical protein ACQP2Y_12355 [Actinoplanes sp. CA-051413]|uniref:hypothetical protein n=1 Tax=Actinoplanes sp. CA-051413 TaxID=3239899 RepID=UPI003D98D9E2
MPGFVLTTTAVMTCPHGGKVTIVPAGARTVAGGPIATVAAVLTVAGCGFTTPCVTVKWANVSARVQVDGQAVLLQATPNGPGGGLCAPTPAPPIVAATQARVVGS